MDVEELLTQEFARRDAYKGLSDCYRLPEEELINTLEGLEQVFETLGSEARSHIALVRSEIKGREDVDDLKVDYARLFVGPYNLLAPPYGSVYLEGERKVMGDSTMDIQKRYAEVGLTTAKFFKEIPDHIRAELEFMYFLIFKEIEAIQEGSFENVSGFLLKQRSFLQDHLAIWVKGLAQNIEVHCQKNFYRGVAMATRIFISEDFSEIAELEISEPTAAVSLG